MKSVIEFVRIFYKKTKTFLQNLLDYEIILLPLCRYLHANASFMKTEMITLKKVSLKDIAAKAGVSTALVSFVLNGKGQEHRIGEETARHILQIAKEMNYRPNLAARGLRSGTTGTLGVVVSDISNPFFAQIARDIEDAADKLGRTVFFGSSDESAEKMKTLISGLINRGVDGLIVVPCEHSEDTIQELCKNKIPLVLLDRNFNDINVSYVVLDNFNAAYKATRHLIDSGYKKVGIIAYDVKLNHMQDRIRGYKEAVAEAGMAANVLVIKQKNFDKAFDKAMRKAMDDGVDALFLPTVTITISCLHYINDHNIEIPKQLGLVGFDGGDAFDLFSVPVSYVSQPVRHLSVKAVEILIDMIVNKNASVQGVRIVGSLIVRQSSLP